MVKWGSPFEGFEERIRYYIANGEFELIKTQTRTFQTCVLCKAEIPPKSRPSVRKYMKDGKWKFQYLCSYCSEKESVQTENNEHILL